MAIDPLSGTWSSHAIRRFTAQLTVLLVGLSALIVVGIHLRTVALVRLSIERQAASYLELIRTARKWNALHGGVWVRMGPRVRTNPYLRELGIEAETSTVSGTRLTLRNPAAMTREISELIERSAHVSFRLTSLDPVNPENAPDEWEREALIALERGAPYVQTDDRTGKRHLFRRIEPLITEPECLTCHRSQGYRPGDVRGALSVSLDLEPIDAEIERNAAALAGIWLFVVTGFLFIMFGLVFRLAERIEQGEARLRELATTDELTGAANRRATMQRLVAELARVRRGSSAGVIVIDIDHFKAVNDSHGHAAGDLVLTKISTAIARCLRAYDLLGRIGGEEFLVVAPDIDAHGLVALADRIRASVEELAVPIPDSGPVTVTVSAGCAMLSTDDTSIEEVLARADRALYAAKAGGRNRVEYT